MAGHQTTIACIWDFDKTLIPLYSEKPLFDYYRVSEKDFWAEVNQLPEKYRQQGMHNVSYDTPYLNHILDYVARGNFKGLNNALLRKLGAKIPFYPGLPEFFTILTDLIATNPVYQKYDLVLEHYIVSTGLYEMIDGSRIGPMVDGVWANEFVEETLSAKRGSKTNKVQRQIAKIGYMIDNTTKTRAVYEINKGVNKLPGITVNMTIPKEKRRVPFEHIIYIADGPSDIPSFSAVNQNGGTSYCVYKPGSRKEFEQAYQLFQDKRVQFFSEANYTQGSQTYLALTHLLTSIANNIVRKIQEENRRPMPEASPLPQHIALDE